MPGYERFVSELYIPPTEIVYDGFVVPDYKRDRVDRGKTRFPQCATCRFEPMCEGPWREYPEMLGSDEFQPVAGARVIDTDIVLDAERFAMLGTPAPLAGLPPLEGKWVALVFYPEDGSPACTAEACSLQSGLPQLSAAGVSLYGISPDPLERHTVFAQQNGLTWPLLSDRDGSIARAFKAGVRSTYLLDAERRIAHVIVNPDVKNHAQQVFDAVKRLTAPARSLERGPELIIRRTAKPLAEAEAELELT
jgi:peroxiredoxin Q/BCP